MRIEKNKVSKAINNLSAKEREVFLLFLQHTRSQPEVLFEHSKGHSRGILISGLIEGDINFSNRLENLFFVLKKDTGLFPKQDLSGGIKTIVYKIAPLEMVYDKNNKSYAVGWAKDLINQFYEELLNKNNKPEKKKEILILNHKKEGQRICRVVKEKPLCYTSKRNEQKGFRIISVLFRTEKTGKPAKEIAERIYFASDAKRQKYIKDHIDNINKNFRKNCELQKDLIIHTKEKGKNIYFLNREYFDFEIER